MSVQTNNVDTLLKVLACAYDEVQLLQCPSGRKDTKWVLLPHISDEHRVEVQKVLFLLK